MEESELILVVDDTPANLAVLSEALTDAGFEVAIATDGERAIKQAESSLPSLILLDVMMPGIDGFETCRRLKASTITQDIPIIFMTALSETTDKVHGFNLGAVDYITKPFQEAELIVRVKTQLKLRHFNQTLEQQVSQRTAELTDALNQLKSSQLKLVQSEKMATLGQLVAGIAHEINNPVSFIYGNLEHMESYTQTLLNALKLYQKYYPQSSEEIKIQAEENDLEFVQEDVIKTLNSMKMGTQRICEIVQSLRNFSHIDEVEFKAVNIHEGIESTIMILQNRLKAKPDYPKIEVIREYGNLPLIECYAGQLNQVFMNILANAIDALEDMNQHRTYQDIQNSPGCITIRTSIVDSERVQIATIDNGPGIPKEIQQRIFEPFFTTKPMGKGTGLGMSISYQIITEKHHGKLECFSTPGKGTQFVIQIPIRQQTDNRMA